MAEIKKIKGVTALKHNELEEVLGVVSEMVKKQGHGLAFDLNKILFDGKKVLKEFYERLEEAKKGFFESDEKGERLKFVFNGKGDLVEEYKEGKDLPEGYKLGYKLKDGINDEFNEMLKSFDAELLNVNFKPLDEKKVTTSFDKGIFDGIDVSYLFGVLIF